MARFPKKIDPLLLALLFVGFVVVGCTGGGNKLGPDDGLIPQEPDPASKTFASATECRICHAGIYGKWQTTKHPLAMEALEEIGQDRNSECWTCHTVGYNAGGFVSREKTEEFEGVQCESCHGSAINHVGGATGVNVGIEILDAETCGKCHDGAHHPTYTEWKDSRHAVSLSSVKELPFFKQDCLECHSADYRFAREDEKPTVADAKLGITCAVCHDPHNKVHPYQLRKEVNEICLECHTLEEAKPVITALDSYESPHHPQKEMFEGRGAVVLVTFENSSHTDLDVNPDECATCHVLQVGFDPESGSAITGHTFRPLVPQACEQCHTGNVTALKEGTQNAIETRLNGLRAYLDSNYAVDDPDQYIDPSTLTGDALVWYYQAKFDYEFVNGDGSRGIHNWKYTMALLDSADQLFDRIGSQGG